MNTAINSMTLYWGPVSPFVRKVMITAYETGLAERISLLRAPVAMNASNSVVMQHNPLSKIPTLVTANGFALFDSDVICEYLDSFHTGDRLIPTDGDAKWQVLRWNAFGSGLLDALVLWRNERMRPDGHQSVETLQTYERKLAASLSMLESEMQVLTEATFSLGHIAIGCMFGYLDYRFPDIEWRSTHPQCAAWNDTFSQRFSAQLTHPALSADMAAHPANKALMGEAIPA